MPGGVHRVTGPGAGWFPGIDTEMGASGCFGQQPQGGAMRKAVLIVSVCAVGMTAWLSTAANGVGAAATQDYERATSFDHAGWTTHCEPSGCVIPIVLPT